jgi:hypothetical protein
MSSTGLEVFKLGYEISPVILVNGVAASIPGQMLPIVALTEAANFTEGLLGGNIETSLDKYFAHWKPLSGTTLIDNEIANVPFANQATAANAVIAKPLVISMMMICPVQTEGGFTSKLATMTVLRQTLAYHNANGGTYTIATPSQIYTNCLLTKVSDISGGTSAQAQHTWQFDFIQPLVTIDAAQQVYNSLMNKIANGYDTGTTPAWSGLPSTLTQNVISVAGDIMPSLSNQIGSLASGITGSATNVFGFVQ